MPHFTGHVARGHAPGGKTVKEALKELEEVVQV
jgi:hypothetical protein